MVFKSFRIKLIIRILILGFVVAGFVYYSQKQHYYFTTVELFIVALLLVIELVYFIEKGYRQLNNMLRSVKERDFGISFTPAEKGKVFTNLAQLLNDLTEGYRKVRIEKELHYQFLNHIVDQISQIMVCFDNDGNIKLANLSSRKLLKTNCIKNISTFSVLDSDFPTLLMNIKQDQEILLPIKYNGELLQFAVNCSTIKLLDKTYKLVVMHDIRIALQEKELDSYRKLIRVLTHEIMNSVTPILSLSEAMNETLRTPNNKPRSLDELSKQESIDLAEGYQAIELRSRALMRFVTDFRSLTKLPEPKLTLVKPEDLIRPILSLLKPIIESKSINLKFSFAKGLKCLMIDKDLLEQVIINLIKNAIEALENISSPRIEIEITLKDSRVNISISDNGKGVDEENYDKIFVPFYSTKRDGSGIGLSLSQQIIRLHRGSIQFKSIPNRGSTFTIILPLPESCN